MTIWKNYHFIKFLGNVVWVEYEMNERDIKLMEGDLFS